MFHREILVHVRLCKMGVYLRIGPKQVCTQNFKCEGLQNWGLFGENQGEAAKQVCTQQCSLNVCKSLAKKGVYLVPCKSLQNWGLFGDGAKQVCRGVCRGL